MRLLAATGPAEGPLPGVSLMVTLLEAADTDHVIPGLARAAALARWPIHATIRPTPTSAPAAARNGRRRSCGPPGYPDPGVCRQRWLTARSCAYPLTTPQSRTFCLLGRIRRAVVRRTHGT